MGQAKSYIYFNIEGETKKKIVDENSIQRRLLQMHGLWRYRCWTTHGVRKIKKTSKIKFKVKYNLVTNISVKKNISLALYKLTVVPFRITEALWANTFCSSFPSLLDNARLLKLRILGVKVWKKVENTELSNFILKKQVGVCVPNPQPQQQP